MIGVICAFLFEGLLCHTIGIPNSSEDSLMLVSQLLLIINVVIVFIYISRRYHEYDQMVTYALILSLALKVALLLWDYYGTAIFVLPNSHLDSEAFHREGVLFAKGIRRSVENYSYVVGYIYRYFGVQRLTAQFFNIILSFLGIDILERTLCVLEINEVARNRTIILSGLLPNFLIMSSILIRECLIAVILCISLYLFAVWWKNNNIFLLVIAEITPLFACYFHSGSIAISIGIAICAVIAKRDRNGERITRITISTIVFSALLFVGFLYLFNRLSGSLLRRFQGLDINAIEGYAEGHHFYESTSGSSSSYSAGIAGISGWRGIIINSPIRIIYFLWSPMPWDIRGIGDIIAFLGSSMFYGGTVISGIYYLIGARFSGKKDATIVCILILAMSGALVFAWGVDSAGSALRHREKFFFIYLLLYGLIQNGRIIDQ